MKSPCIICGTENERDHYVSDYTCRTCGQEYGFDEGMMMVLTEEQYEVLRQHHQDTLEEES